MDIDALSGGSSTSRNDELIDQVRNLVMQDHRLTVLELAEEVGISTGSVHSILTNDLSMRRVWQLHHDNAPAHSSQLIQTFLAKHNIPVVRQNPYSPDRFPALPTGSLLSRQVPYSPDMAPYSPDRLPTLPTWLLAIFGCFPT